MGRAVTLKELRNGLKNRWQDDNYESSYIKDENTGEIRLNPRCFKAAYKQGKRLLDRMR